MPTKKPEHALSQLYTERNRYFTGKYLTARDFRDEQKYFLSHHRWHQWTLHGWGIVWGLQVKTVGDGCLRIEPGMSIDCHGRNLVLPYAVQFAVNDLPDLDEGYEPDDILIGLQFKTIHRDPVPILLDDPSECSDPAKDNHNREHELAKICWRKYCEKCWTYPPVYLSANLPQPVSHHPDHGSDLDEIQTLHLSEHNDPDTCRRWSPPVEMKPPCECGECGFVPLARLRKGDVWTMDDLGCRYVPSPFYGESLTHIIGINWNHGGQTCFQKLRNDASSQPTGEGMVAFAQKQLAPCDGLAGRIIIEFDRPLGLQAIENEGAAALTTYFTQLLKLEYIEIAGCHGDHDLDGDDLPTWVAPKVVHLSGCRKKLYIDFPAQRMIRDLPVRMRLTLNCDMVLDERGRAVDGEHIGGHVPNLYDKEAKIRGRSGDGTEGGMFTSWTKLTPAK